jgi:hypothetical protein
MGITKAMTIIQEAVEAHGGVERWKRLEAIEAVISASGFLFTVKWRPALKRVRMRAETREPRFSFLDFPRPGQTGELIGDEEVRIKDRDGNTIARRLQPRSAFRHIRRQLYWDDLDFVYFGGYATWNYLTMPFLFLREGFSFEELSPIAGELALCSRIRVTFPPDIPTHCTRQVLYFDEERHLRRIDYTAEVVGRWAHAAHLCENYREFDGIKAPTRRRVLPLFSRSYPLSGPTLVALDIHDLRPVPGG